MFPSLLKWVESVSNPNNKIFFNCNKFKIVVNRQEECWVKKTNPDLDVSMESLDTAEVCELVGLFLLFKLEWLIPKDQIRLYRDYGLAVVELPGPEVERLRGC